MSTLTPKRVEPGWLKRWTWQSLELYRRAPLVPILYTAVWSGFIIWASQVKYLFLLLFMVLAVTLFYLFLRAMDEHPRQVLSTFHGYLTNSWRDIYNLLRMAGIVSLAIVGLGIVINLAMYYMPTVHIPGMKSYLIPPNYSLMERTFIMGGFMSTFILAIFGEWLLTIYLTLLLGYDYHVNTSLMQQGIQLNYRTLPLVFMFTMFVNVLLMLSIPYVTNPIGGWVLGVFLMAAFTWLNTWGYLASREMFEGRGKNCEVKVTESETALSGGVA